MKNEYQEYLAWTYFGEDAYDKQEFKRLPPLLKSIELFIDIGASHGVYTFHANRILHNSEIIAVEADPNRFAILQENVTKWLKDSTNTITCIHAAVSDADDIRDNGTVTFYVTDTQISGGLFPVPERSDDYKPTTVRLVELDDYFRPDTPTMVKIDVEGSELRVLKGARKHIESGKTIFLSEISWFGDRQRGTGPLDVLFFAFANGLRVDRRGRSNYLLVSEPRRFAQAWSVARCLPLLMARTVWNRFIPPSIREKRERHLIERRLARYRKKRA